MNKCENCPQRKMVYSELSAFEEASKFAFEHRLLHSIVTGGLESPKKVSEYRQALDEYVDNCDGTNCKIILEVASKHLGRTATR